MDNIYDVIVIGSGAAAWNAARVLRSRGAAGASGKTPRVAVVTEGRFMGTSRNTGSDKQTYYKLSMSGAAADSVGALARSLYDGGSVDGDVAYAEAAGSARGFIELVSLGVPFPSDEYGAFAGYRTDHDAPGGASPARATSAGPLTSRYMTEALEKSALSLGAELVDGWRVYEIIKDALGACGVRCVSRDGRTCELYARDVIAATGGPAGLYERSVYPESQTGALGLLVRAGCDCANLCEWQYGLASVDFRWNVSGTYQQVVPKYVSVSPDGSEREFLAEALTDPSELEELVFLKGYQWPFDVKKTGGSSKIDLLVRDETARGNEVYMDFRENPSALAHGFGALRGEAREYLENSGALFGTPFERLMKMNPKAVELYRSHGIDLERERLRIAVCAQHCNGGAAVDPDWRTTVPHLYCAGEAAGTFGVCRPGGSALNSTQVGSLRAAEAVLRSRLRGEDALGAPSEADDRFPDSSPDAGEMSRYAANLRVSEEMDRMLGSALSEYEAMRPCAPTWERASARDMLASRVAVLGAMSCAAKTCGSRGSALVTRAGNAVPEDESFRERVLVTTSSGNSFWRARRPLPSPDGWFENVWREYNARWGR